MVMRAKGKGLGFEHVSSKNYNNGSNTLVAIIQVRENYV